MSVSRFIAFACLTSIFAALPAAAQSPPPTTGAAAPEAAQLPALIPGTLSPSEQKRAERARARAVSLSGKSATAAKASATMTQTRAAPETRDIPHVRQVATPRTAGRRAAMQTHYASGHVDRRHAALDPRPLRRRTRAAALSRDHASGRPPRVGDIVPYNVPLTSTPPHYAYPDRRTAMDAPRGPWPYPLYRPFYRPMVRPEVPPFYGPRYE